MGGGGSRGVGEAVPGQRWWLKRKIPGWQQPVHSSVEVHGMLDVHRK